MSRNKWRDRVLLVVTACVLLFGGMMVEGLIKPLLDATWREFVMVGIFYGLGLMYFALSSNEFDSLPKSKLVVFQLVFFVLSTGTSFAVFYYKLLPMPSHAVSYALAMACLLTGSMVLLEYAVHNWAYFKNSKRDNNQGPT